VTSLSSLPGPCICFQAGNTPFHNAAEGGHVGVMEYLVELGAKYDEKNNVSCHTPLFCLCFNMSERRRV
jgi:ankyrin repeat protein